MVQTSCATAPFRKRCAFIGSTWDSESIICVRYSLKADRPSIEARENATVALAGKSLSEHRCHSSAMKNERYTSTTREMRDVSCVIRHTEELVFNKV